MRANNRGYYPPTSRAQRGVLCAAFRATYPTAYQPPIAFPVSLLIQIAGARRNSDASNHAKMVEDALVDAGVLSDDNVSIVQELVVRVVDGEPRTVVTISRVPGVAQSKRIRKRPALLNLNRKRRAKRARTVASFVNLATRRIGG